jgi:hypothetical protein
MTSLRYVHDPSEPDDQQWDTLYVMLWELETHAHLLRLLEPLLRGDDGQGPLWLWRGKVLAVFN